MRLDGNSVARVAIPLDSRLASLVTGPTRNYLRLCRLPRSSSRFIFERIGKAVRKVTGRRADSPVPVRLTLRTRAGKVEVTLRVSAPPRRRGGLASLVRGAPADVKAVCRTGPRGVTLSFTTSPLRAE